MTCQELIDFLAEYIDGSLDDAVRGAFESHLTRCADCRAFLGSYRATVELAASLRESSGADDQEAAVPPELPEDLVAAVLHARESAS
ncbi:MAG TPA: zf-HC2 domain-containing protein [Phycisphaerales bacterium]|nr:zf-HC2 domain-containing protein [Phycisphaerales bacterium]HMP36028.1 zf-HC2 domain-containing protein [Phycisphaerales bacterium]